MAVDLRRQKELDADPKAIQQIEYVGQLKKQDAAADDDNYTESVFILTILKEINEARLTFSQGSETVL